MVRSRLRHRKRTIEGEDMETKKKCYIAPAAELILLAPSEALATQADDNLALNQWGVGSVNVPETASTVSGGYIWGEDGTITQSGS